MRHVHECPPFHSPVATLEYDFSHGHLIPDHRHPEDQFVYASAGVMTIRTADASWVVPPRRAVWIPARTPHNVSMSGRVSMRTLYLRGRMVRRLPRTCCVVHVSALLQELILHACQYPTLSRRSRIQAHLIDVIVDQLEQLNAIPLQLPGPSDARAARLAAILEKNPGSAKPIEELCRQAGGSKRTIERLFRRETNLTLGRWRQQLRLMRSLQLIAAGEKITTAALEAGYSTPSAFIAMFRKALGTTPRKYFEQQSAI